MMKKNDLFRDRTFFQMGIVMFYYNIFRNLSQYFYKRQKKEGCEETGLKTCLLHIPLQGYSLQFYIGKK